MTDLSAAADAAELARKELRAWLEEHFTPEVREAVAHRYEGDAHIDPFEAQRAWNATLFDGGWAAPSWPAAFGGRDAGILEQLALNEEMDLAGAPGPVNAIGVANIAPAIMTYGTPEQQERFLRPMLRGDHIWSQGMSEPEAGSDLASLRCRAELDGDDFVVTGQKTWNSNGDKAHWCQLYVRTDASGPKHQGITCLLVDMSTPGIEVRPIRTMAGDSGFAEVFFDEVRIPRSALLGTVDEGWNVATRTLSNERAGVATLYLHLRRKLDRLIEEAGEPSPDGRRPTDSAVVRDALAARYTDVRVLELRFTAQGSTPQKPVKAVVTWIIPAQLARVTGDGSWLGSSPRYVLESGVLRHTGSFNEYRLFNPIAGARYLLGEQFAFVDAIGRKQRQDEQMELFVAIMARLQQYAREKFDAPLIVIYSWPDEQAKEGSWAGAAMSATAVVLVATGSLFVASGAATAVWAGALAGTAQTVSLRSLTNSGPRMVSFSISTSTTFMKQSASRLSMATTSL